MSEIVDRLYYRVNNPSAWPEGFDEAGSELFREAASYIKAKEAEIASLRIALVRVTHLYEAEHDPEIIVRPNWLVNALKDDLSSHNPEKEE